MTRGWLRKTLRTLAATMAFGLVAPVAQAQKVEPTFTIGVLPNISARLILASYQPMRDYFERELRRSVDIATAADFRQFTERTLRGDYQLIVTAPNLGRVVQLEASWDPLAMYEPRIPALLVALADNPDSSPVQLRGKALALANPQSLVALAGMQWLRGQGLQEGSDYRITLAANDDSLGAVLRSGEAPLAIMSGGEFRAKPESVRKLLRVVSEITQLPGFLVMANPRLPESEKQRLKALILAFPQTEEGRRFFGLSGFSNIRPVLESELKGLDPYVEQTRKGLGLVR
ncbi:MAG: PhnD/SsuA/transferrin family substrate-binding protein [Burkholderiales bacterium]|nr:PhnD/SsuA/transferrin family substrate-binding protein [Burkholderiales bacterium]